MNNVYRIIGCVIGLPGFLAGVLIRPLIIGWNVGCHAVDEQVSALYPELTSDADDDKS